MKLGIAFRLVVSHLLLVALALAVFVGVIGRVTDRVATAAGQRADQATAARLAPWIERYYRERGSWVGLARLLDDRRLPLDVQPQGDPERMRPMMPNRGPRMSGPDRMMMPSDPQVRTLLEQPLLLLDPSGSLILARGVPDVLIAARRRDPSTGFPVGEPEAPVAVLFVGSMVNPEANPVRVLFSRAIAAASLLTVVVVLIAATIATLLWTRRIVRPVRAMATASSTMAAGDYRVRVSVPPGGDELSELSGAFNEMAAQVEAQETSRRRFVADSAHELRTPLALLAARVEMLESGVYAPGAEQWQRLHDDIARMQRLVDDLQTLSRLEAGRIELRRERLDLAAVARGAVAAFEPVAADRSVRLVCECSEAAVVADPERLHQIVANLLSNAIRYTPAGGRVMVGCRPGDAPTVGGALLWVEDEGPGIPPGDRERVFQRFVRLDDARDRAHGGSGLGLAISAELARLHGGTIRVEDRAAGTGARFVLTLPRAE
ncbi:MAG: sensor histidine kinase [Spirochaetaceae bacterium]|nr:MAG: sensor histidine kinase [Spirochaetaceae bacterium]